MTEVYENFTLYEYYIALVSLMNSRKQKLIFNNIGNHLNVSFTNRLLSDKTLVLLLRTPRPVNTNGGPMNPSRGPSAKVYIEICMFLFLHPTLFEICRFFVSETKDWTHRV